MGLFNKKKSAAAEAEAPAEQGRRRSSLQGFAENAERKLSVWSNKDGKTEAEGQKPRKSSRIADTQAVQAAFWGAK